jgi:hypothetical protein
VVPEGNCIPVVPENCAVDAAIFETLVMFLVSSITVVPPILMAIFVLP